jgi:hypothetical protein
MTRHNREERRKQFITVKIATTHLFVSDSLNVSSKTKG